MTVARLFSKTAPTGGRQMGQMYVLNMVGRCILSMAMSCL